MKDRPLILASESPRRRQLLAERGYAFRVVAPPFEEPDQLTRNLAPPQLAEALSYFKARSVALDGVNDGLILGGDTVVALRCRIFGKPENRDDARRILTALVGTTHDVITGVTLLDAATLRRSIRHDSTAVAMRTLAPDEVEAYLDTGAWEGKAGAYGIQDHGDAFVTAVEGSFTNVVGFPMELVTQMLAEWGVTPESRCTPDEPAAR